MSRFLEYIILFILALLFQIALFDHVQLGSFALLTIYPIFILFLPLDCDSWKVLLLSALMGLCVDLLSAGAGVNMASMALLGLCRNGVATLFLGKNDQLRGVATISSIGTSKFMLYSSSLILLFFIPYFILETLSLFNLGLLILRVICSTIVSTLLIAVISLPLFKTTKFE